MSEALETDTMRRRTLGRLAGAMAIGVGGWSIRAGAQSLPDGRTESWPGPLKGTYHQVFDGVESRTGKVLAYAANFLAGDPEATSAAVVIVRDTAVVIALGNEIWAKYKIGETLHFIDPETRAAAVKNPFLRPKPGVLGNDDWALDRLLAKGVVVGACTVALTGVSHALAHNAGVSAEDATREWRANLVPGVALLPSGVWGVNRAQRAGCSYCFGT
jgi:intracellular sulfur oxidation DsrE/DsrF family protein